MSGFTWVLYLRNHIRTTRCTKNQALKTNKKKRKILIGNPFIIKKQLKQPFIDVCARIKSTINNEFFFFFFFFLFFKSFPIDSIEKYTSVRFKYLSAAVQPLGCIFPIILLHVVAFGRNKFYVYNIRQVYFYRVRQFYHRHQLSMNIHFIYDKLAMFLSGHNIDFSQKA